MKINGCSAGFPLLDGINSLHGLMVKYFRKNSVVKIWLLTLTIKGPKFLKNYFSTKFLKNFLICQPTFKNELIYLVK